MFLNWLSESLLEIDGIRFDVVCDSRAEELSSTSRRFVLIKRPSMVEFYADLLDRLKPRSILEIGIFKGGSVVLLHRLAHPERLVAIDIAPDPATALDQYVARERLADVVRLHYGVDQANAQALRGIVAEEFGGRPLDLVIDDGCHWLPESRAAFNALFPYLRPGGVYVLEDWGWAHWPGIWQQDGGPWAHRPALTALLFEQIMVAASYPEIIAKVEVDSTLASATRGGGALSPSTFDSASAYLSAGRTFGERKAAHPLTNVLRRSLPVALLRRARTACGVPLTQGLRSLWLRALGKLPTGSGPHA